MHWQQRALIKASSRRAHGHCAWAFPRVYKVVQLSRKTRRHGLCTALWGITEPNCPIGYKANESPLQLTSSPSLTLLPALLPVAEIQLVRPLFAKYVKSLLLQCPSASLCPLPSSLTLTPYKTCFSRSLSVSAAHVVLYEVLEVSCAVRWP